MRRSPVALGSVFVLCFATASVVVEEAVRCLRRGRRVIAAPLPPLSFVVVAVAVLADDIGGADDVVVLVETGCC